MSAMCTLCFTICNLGFQSRQSSGDMLYCWHVYLNKKNFMNKVFSSLIQGITMSVHHRDTELGMRSTLHFRQSTLSHESEALPGRNCTSNALLNEYMMLIFKIKLCRNDAKDF